VPPIRYPESAVFYRKLTRAYPRIARGEGCYLYDDEGKQYLDASGGAFVVNVGHGVAEIADAIAAQAKQVAYVNGTAFTTEPVERMAVELASHLPEGLDKIYFLSSGSEAVEAALKLARQYWVERGRPRKHKIIALAPGYHGNTLLALSAGARAHYSTYFADWLVEVRRIPAPYAYRCDCGGAADCARCSGEMLERAIRDEGAETVAAFIAEPVGGSSTGAAVPRPSYFPRVREICDQFDVLFIADEIACGAGRTGTFTAIEQSGVTPDIMTLGKGIAGGYVPLAAVAAPRRIVDVLARGSGALLHAQTFSHHAVSCAAGLATLRVLRERGLVERSAAMGAVLHRQLSTLRALPHIGDVRGRGLFAGVEFVEDVETRAPFPRSARFAERFTDAALRAGLNLWPNVGHADGTNGDLVMIAPPFIITEAQIGEILARFTEALEETVATLTSEAVHGH